MKYTKKHKIFFYIFIGILLTIILFLELPSITYNVDYTRILKGKEPIFVIKKDVCKDGGTTLYLGLNYQVIRWNRLASRVESGKTIHGIEVGYEIHKYPDYRHISDGPEKELEFQSYK